MIFHANLSALSNFTNLNTAYNKSLKNPVVFETGKMIRNGGEIFIKDDGVDQRISNVQNKTLESLFVSINQHTFFINFLQELVSPDAEQAAVFIEKIKKTNQRTIQNYLGHLEDSLGKPSDLQRDSITSKETLFDSLTPRIVTKRDAGTNTPFVNISVRNVCVRG